MKHLTPAALFVSIVAVTSCTRSSGDTGAGGDAEAGVGSNPDGGAKPLSLSDARLDKYLSYRKELNQCLSRYQKKMTEVATAVGSKATDLGKGITAATGVARLGEEHEKEVAALRARHGFSAAEDDRLWNAVTEVTAALSSQNPMAADGFKAYRDMQARGGEEKKVADELLRELEGKEKQDLDRARMLYGDACVDVLSKRARELHQFQLDMIKDLMGQPEPEAR